MEVVRRAMRERRFSERTIEAYTSWIRRYIEFHGRRHPRDMDAEDVSAFLSDLAVKQRVAASTQNQALAALTFLYTKVLRRPLARMPNLQPATAPKRLPVVMSEVEVRAVLDKLREPDRLAVSLLYGSGLRILECVSLRVKDIDLDRREITVRAGRVTRTGGRRSRIVPLLICSASCARRTSAGVMIVGVTYALRVWEGRSPGSFPTRTANGRGITFFPRPGL
jgi:integrase